VAFLPRIDISNSRDTTMDKSRRLLTSVCLSLALMASAAAAQTPDAPPAPEPAQPAVPAPLAAPLAFAWQVDQRFRLWSGADKAALDQLLSTLAMTNDPDQVHDQIVAFLKARPALHRKAFWDPGPRRYDLSYLYPRA
jgi:hypothetical protein